MSTKKLTIGTKVKLLGDGEYAGYTGVIKNYVYGMFIVINDDPLYTVLLDELKDGYIKIQVTAKRNAIKVIE